MGLSTTPASGIEGWAAALGHTASHKLMFMCKGPEASERQRASGSHGCAGATHAQSRSCKGGGQGKLAEALGVEPGRHSALADFGCTPPP